jgi:cbb3-type cytochrome oxidase subunit 3
MKAEYLAHYGLTYLNCFGMLLFLAIFVGALIWVYRRSSKSFYQYMEALPLQED